MLQALVRRGRAGVSRLARTFRAPHHRALAAVAPLVAALVLGCGGEQKPRLVITGSSTIAPLVAEIARRFESTHPGVRVDVQTGGSSRGVADPRKGLADIGMVSRAAKGNEGDLQWFAIARDGIAIIVNAGNTVPGILEPGLTSHQVRAIYRGEMQSWAGLGGEDHPITVVHKVEGRSTLELFLAFFELKNTEVKPDVEIGDNQQGIRTVAGDPHAIAYVSIGTAEFEAERGTAIRLVPVDGVAPSTVAVQDGTFPLSRPLHLVTTQAPEGLVREMIDFAQSEAVHDLVREQFFVPLQR